MVWTGTALTLTTVDPRAEKLKMELGMSVSQLLSVVSSAETDSISVKLSSATKQQYLPLPGIETPVIQPWYFPLSGIESRSQPTTSW